MAAEKHPYYQEEKKRLETTLGYVEKSIAGMLQERAALRLRNLLTARERPYFARIDFHESEKLIGESLYIGKMALGRRKLPES